MTANLVLLVAAVAGLSGCRKREGRWTFTIIPGTPPTLAKGTP